MFNSKPATERPRKEAAAAEIPQNYGYAFTGKKSDALKAIVEARDKPEFPKAILDMADARLAAISGDDAIVMVRVQGGRVHGGSHAMWADSVEIHHLA